jgi:hypothetical protein
MAVTLQSSDGFLKAKNKSFMVPRIKPDRKLKEREEINIKIKINFIVHTFKQTSS